MNAFRNPFESSFGLGNNGFEVSLNYISGIPDANVIFDPSMKVIFKALLKRDSTTKEKALYTFLTDFDSLEVDDLTIICWVQLYPKLAIDNSKNVRSYAHQIQGLIVKKLGKHYAKYLKDTVAVWLMGYYDLDRSVTKTTQDSLLDAFGDQNKVDKLWALFEKQILGLCYQIFSFESAGTLSDQKVVSGELSEMKFNRVVLASINLFNKLLESLFSTETKYLSDYEKIYELDQLWNCFSLSDLSIKRTFLCLIRLSIQKTRFLEERNIQRLFQRSLLSGLKLPDNSSNLVFSNIIIPLLETLLVVNKFDSSIWKSSKKFRSRVLNLIALSSCNSSTSYYDYLTVLLKCLDGTLFDFNTIDDFNAIFELLVKDIVSERQIEFRKKAWSCLFSFIEDCSDKQNVREVITDRLSTVLEQQLKTQLGDPIISIISKSFNNFSSEQLIQVLKEKVKLVPSKDLELAQQSKNLNSNWFKITSALKNPSMDNQVSLAFDSLRNSETPSVQLEVITQVIKGNLTQYNSQIQNLITELPFYINTTFIDEPLSVLQIYHDYIEFDEALFNNCINSLTSKIISIDKKFMSRLLNVIAPFSFDIGKAPILHQYLTKASEEYDFADNGLIFSFTNKLILSNVINRAEKTSKEIIFIEYFTRHPSSAASIVDSIDDLKSIIRYALINNASTVAMKFLDIIQTYLSNESVSTIYFPLIIDLIKNSNIELKTLIQYVRKLFVSSSKDVVIQHLIIKNSLDKNLKEIIGNRPNSALSIANPLEGNVFLLPTTTNTIFLEKSLVRYSQFLSQLTEEPKVIQELPLNKYAELVINVAIAKEVYDDSIFLSTDSSSPLIEDSEFTGSLFDQLFSIKLNDVVPYINGDTLVHDSIPFTIVALLFDIDSTNYSYYKSRVLKKVLSAMFENESLVKFEDAKINFNALIKIPMKFATVVLSSKKFLAAFKYERVRNMIASELLGVKRNEILTKGLQLITLLTNLLNIDDCAKGFVPVQQQRLMMILSNLESWSESEVAYDDEFVPMRVQLANFFTIYIGLPVQKPSKLLDIAFNLCRDNLGIISAGFPSVELKYFTFRLFILLERNHVEIDGWDEEINIIYEEIVEILLSDTDNTINQPIGLTQNLLFRITHNIPSKLFSGSFDKLFKLLDSNSVVIQRIGVLTLKELIPARQSDFVVEYQLQNSKLNDDDEESLKAELPSYLIENITHPSDIDYLENEEEYIIFKYLWSWYLIMTYFKDITFKIRSSYLSQLKSKNLVSQLLDFVFEQIDISADAKLIKGLSEEDVLNYELTSYEVYDEAVNEAKHLLIHLFYLCLKNFGSLAQHWFLDIRNRESKQIVEQFTIEKISPILINDNLNSVETSLSAKKTNDENLTITINRILFEVRSVYLIDEQSMKMIIKIPPSYPLANIQVEGPVRIGVKENQWRAWLLASQRIVTLQNGTIAEAIELFNKNVTLHFSGFEECAICYSILHQDHSLPSKNCQTCNNKFHSACLYKWFKTSGSSTCPLCRSTFNFRK